MRYVESGVKSMVLSNHDARDGFSGISGLAVWYIIELVMMGVSDVYDKMKLNV